MSIETNKHNLEEHNLENTRKFNNVTKQERDGRNLRGTNLDSGINRNSNFAFQKPVPNLEKRESVEHPQTARKSLSTREQRGARMDQGQNRIAHTEVQRQNKSQEARHNPENPPQKPRSLNQREQRGGRLDTNAKLSLAENGLERENKTAQQSEQKTDAPTAQQSEQKTDAPTAQQTEQKTDAPAAQQSEQKTDAPAAQQTEQNADTPRAQQSEQKTDAPAAQQTEQNADTPRAQQSEQKTDAPAAQQTEQNADTPRAQQSEQKTDAPAAQQSEQKTDAPTAQQSEQKTDAPAAQQANNKDSCFDGDVKKSDISEDGAAFNKQSPKEVDNTPTNIGDQNSLDDVPDKKELTPRERRALEKKQKKEENNIDETHRELMSLHYQANKPNISADGKRKFYSAETEAKTVGHMKDLYKKIDDLEKQIKELDPSKPEDASKMRALKYSLADKKTMLENTKLFLDTMMEYRRSAALKDSNARLKLRDASRPGNRKALMEDRAQVRENTAIIAGLRKEMSEITQTKNDVDAKLIHLVHTYEESELRGSKYFAALKEQYNELSAKESGLATQIDRLNSYNQQLAEIWGQDKNGKDILAVHSDEWDKTKVTADDIVAVVDKIKQLQDTEIGKNELTVEKCREILDSIQNIEREILPALHDQILDVRGQAYAAHEYIENNPDSAYKPSMEKFKQELTEKLSEKIEQHAVLVQAVTLLRDHLPLEDQTHTARFITNPDGTSVLIQRWSTTKDKEFASGKSQVFADSSEKIVTDCFDESGKVIAHDFAYKYKILGYASHWKLGGDKFNLENLFEAGLGNLGIKYGYNKEKIGFGYYANARCSVVEAKNNTRLNAFNNQILSTNLVMCLMGIFGNISQKNGLPSVKYFGNDGLTINGTLSLGKLGCASAEYKKHDDVFAGGYDIPSSIDGKAGEDMWSSSSDKLQEYALSVGDGIDLFEYKNKNGETIMTSCLTDCMDLFKTAEGVSEIVSQMDTIIDIQKNGLFENEETDEGNVALRQSGKNAQSFQKEESTIDIAQNQHYVVETDQESVAKHDASMGSLEDTMKNKTDISISPDTKKAPDFVALIRQAKGFINLMQGLVTDDTGENALKMAEEVVNASIGDEPSCGENKHFEKTNELAEAIDEAIEKFDDTLKLLASTSRSDKSAYISADEFFTTMKEVIKNTKYSIKDQATLLDGINTVLHRGLHSNSEKRTLNKLANTFRNAADNAGTNPEKAERYQKAADVVRNLLNPDAPAIRYETGLWIVFRYGVGTRPNNKTERHYVKNAQLSSMLSYRKVKKLLENGGLKGLLTDIEHNRRPSADVKVSGRKILGLHQYTVIASRIGTVAANVQKSDMATSISASGAVAEIAKTSWIGGKKIAFYALSAHNLVNSSVEYKTASGLSAMVKLVENVYGVGIQTPKHVIGLRVDLSIVQKLQNPLQRLFKGLKGEEQIEGTEGAETAGESERENILKHFPIKIVFKKRTQQ